MLKHWSRLAAVLSLVVASSTVGHSQNSQTAHGSAFEVVSIRPTQFTLGCYSMLPAGTTHYGVTCITLRELIARAWMVHPDNIQGGDSGALGNLYSVSAVTPNGLRWNLDNVRPMLRQMLGERFHVSVHTGTKQVSGYALLVSKTGPKLVAAKDVGEPQGHRAGQAFSNFVLTGYIHGRNIDLNGLVALLSSAAGEAVADQTGISGTFDVDVHFAKEGDTESTWPDLASALRQQLGLELRAQKLTIRTLVVEHADESPTPN